MITYHSKMNNYKAKKIAEETIKAIDNKIYKTASGRSVSLDKLILPAIRMSKLYKPGEPELETKESKNTNPQIFVTKETTLEAAARLSGDNVCILNFASAKHPGGGFLYGAMAQEESIARSSALYHTLVVHPEFYEENKKISNEHPELYLDYAIYSPKVPVIRTDDGDWLDEPYLVSIVTSPAPNRSAIFCNPKAPMVGDKRRSDFFMGVEEKIVESIRNRIDQILKIMVIQGHRNIVLGAWGCGVFGNVPLVVATMFKHGLEKYPYFDNIVFAIYAGSDEMNQAFEKVFGFNL